MQLAFDMRRRHHRVAHDRRPSAGHTRSFLLWPFSRCCAVAAAYVYGKPFRIGAMREVIDLVSAPVTSARTACARPCEQHADELHPGVRFTQTCSYAHAPAITIFSSCDRRRYRGVLDLTRMFRDAKLRTRPEHYLNNPDADLTRRLEQLDHSIKFIRAHTAARGCSCSSRALAYLAALRRRWSICLRCCLLMMAPLVRAGTRRDLQR